jgi:hypothetical protein
MLRIFLTVALLGLAVAACGGGNVAQTGPAPTRVTVGQVRRAFAGAGLHLRQVEKVDVPTLQSDLRSKIESRLPGVQLEPQEQLGPGEWLWIVVGDEDSDEEYSTGFPNSVDLETGKVIADDGGVLCVFHNAAIGFNVRRLALAERILTAADRMERTGR